MRTLDDVNDWAQFKAEILELKADCAADGCLWTADEISALLGFPVTATYLHSLGAVLVGLGQWDASVIPSAWADQLARLEASVRAYERRRVAVPLHLPDRWGLCPRCRRYDGYVDIGGMAWMFCLRHRTFWPGGPITWVRLLVPEEQTARKWAALMAMEPVLPLRRRR